MESKSMRYSFYLLVLFLATFAIAQTPDGVKEPTYFQYAFDRSAKGLKSIYDTGDSVKFLNYFNEHKDELDKKSPKFDYWYYMVSKKYNDQFEAALSPLLLSANSILSKDTFQISDWEKANTLNITLLAMMRDYISFTLLRDPRFTSHKFRDLWSTNNNMKIYFTSHRDESFKYYLTQNFKKPFFDMYPSSDSINVNQFYENHIPLLLEHADKETTIVNDYILAELKSHLSKNNLFAYIERGSHFNSRSHDWKYYYDTFNYLDSISISKELIDNLFYKYFELWILDKPIDTNSNLHINYKDIRLKALSLDKEQEIQDPSYPKSIVLLVNTNLKSDRKVLDKQDITSKLLSGYHFEDNPEYFKIQSWVESAKYEYNAARAAQAQFNATNNGSAGLAGGFNAAAIGFRLGRAQQNLNQAISTLGSTPRQIRVPDYSEYSYSTSKIQLDKKFSTTLYFLDPKSQTGIKLPYTTETSKIFNLAYNLNPKDPDYAQLMASYDKESSILAEENNSINFELTNIIQSLKHIPPTSINFSIIFSEIHDKTKFTTIPTKNDSETSNGQKRTDERFNSVVIVKNPSGSIGSGFYVAPNLILTNQHVITGTMFPEIITHSGDTCVGKVIKIDIGLDLALIRVAISGSPIRFSEDIPDSGTSVDAIGHPEGLYFSLTRGVISAIRYIPNPLVPGSRRMLVVQTDAAINPGNSGGPLFIGDKVIGINSQKLSAKGVEGLGFALHASEIEKFLQDLSK